MENTSSDFNTNEELKDAPLLRSLKSSNPFSAPESYFDSLSANIQDRIQQEEKQAITHGFMPKPVIIGISFFIAALFIAYYQFDFGTLSKEQRSENTDSISCEMIVNSDYYMELDEDLLTEKIEASEKTAIEKNLISDDEIENYLVQTTDESFLTYEL